MSELLVHQVQVGPVDNFLYWLGDSATKEMVVIDPAWDVPFILAEVARLGYTLTAVWLTHGHADHVNGLAELLAAHEVPVYMSVDEAERFRPAVPLHDIREGDQLTVGSLTFDCILTPGHSPGGVVFYHAPHLIAGDTLFIDGCGRCDLPGSDVEAMYESIHHKLMILPDETIIYPGHDYGPRPFDTLGNQKQTNKYMLAADKDEFIKIRMGG